MQVNYNIRVGLMAQGMIISYMKSIFKLLHKRQFSIQKYPKEGLNLISADAEGRIHNSFIWICQLCLCINLFNPVFWVLTAKKILYLVQLTVLWHCARVQPKQTRVLQGVDLSEYTRAGDSYFKKPNFIISFYLTGRKLLYRRKRRMKFILKINVS